MTTRVREFRTRIMVEPIPGSKGKWWHHVTVVELMPNGWPCDRAEGYTEGTRRDAEGLAAELLREARATGGAA